MGSLRRLVRRARGTQRGLSTVEVLVAVVVLAIALVATLQTLAASELASAVSRSTVEAHDVATYLLSEGTAIGCASAGVNLPASQATRLEAACPHATTSSSGAKTLGDSGTLVACATTSGSVTLAACTPGSATSPQAFLAQFYVTWFAAQPDELPACSHPNFHSGLCSQPGSATSCPTGFATPIGYQETVTVSWTLGAVVQNPDHGSVLGHSIVVARTEPVPSGPVAFHEPGEGQLEVVWPPARSHHHHSFFSGSSQAPASTTARSYPAPGQVAFTPSGVRTALAASSGGPSEVRYENPWGCAWYPYVPAGTYTLSVGTKTSSYTVSAGELTVVDAP